MKKDIWKIILSFCIIVMLFFSGCTENTNTTDENSQNDISDEEEHAGDTQSVSTPLYPDMTEALYSEPSFWTEMNVDSSLTKTMYHSDSSIETIINWYKNDDNIDNWTLKSSKLIEDPEDFFVSNGEAYLQLEDEGVYISSMVAKDMPISASTVIGIARGSWNLISNCGIETQNQEHLFMPVDALDEGTITFERIIVDSEAYSSINPLGDLSPEGHTFPTDHGAFWLTHASGSNPVDNVYAPADGAIIRIRYTKETNYNDYMVFIAHTNTFYSYIGHMSEIDSSILGETGTLSEGENNFDQNPVMVTKGQIIGKTGGTNGEQNSMYWGILDADKTLQYANSDRYNIYSHAAHFIEYCDEPLQTTLKNQIGSAPPYNYKRTAEPLWGEVDYYKDHLNTLVGNWFHNSINENDPMAEFDKHLSFVYDMWDPTQIRIGIGGTLAVTATVYKVTGNTPDPKDITAGDTAVFKLQGTEEFGESSLKATIMVDMINTETIKVEAFSGHLDNPSFTTNAQTYIK
ncbi:MAG: M23 family metallopeptidase [Atribacterota bacterium]